MKLSPVNFLVALWQGCIFRPAGRRHRSRTHTHIRGAAIGMESSCTAPVVEASASLPQQLFVQGGIDELMPWCTGESTADPLADSGPVTGALKARYVGPPTTSQLASYGVTLMSLCSVDLLTL